MNEVVDFITQDLNEAAFIWSQSGAKIKNLIPRSDSGKKDVYKFQFELEMAHADLQKLLFDYQNGDTCVEPFEFVKNQNNLRDILRRVRAKK